MLEQTHRALEMFFPGDIGLRKWTIIGLTGNHWSRRLSRMKRGLKIWKH
jgi:hypothetical protein